MVPTRMMKSVLPLFLICVFPMHAAERPPITGIANIAVKVDNLQEARQFYSGVVGLDEAFSTRDPAVSGLLACFKVNDRQFVEVSPTLKDENEDRLIRIGFE